MGGGGHRRGRGTGRGGGQVGEGHRRGRGTGGWWGHRRGRGTGRGGAQVGEGLTCSNVAVSVFVIIECVNTGIRRVPW